MTGKGYTPASKSHNFSQLVSSWQGRRRHRSEHMKVAFCKTCRFLLQTNPAACKSPDLFSISSLKQYAVCCHDWQDRPTGRSGQTAETDRTGRQERQISHLSSGCFPLQLVTTQQTCSNPRNPFQVRGQEDTQACSIAAAPRAHPTATRCSETHAGPCSRASKHPQRPAQQSLLWCI